MSEQNTLTRCICGLVDRVDHFWQMVGALSSSLEEAAWPSR